MNTNKIRRSEFPRASHYVGPMVEIRHGGKLYRVPVQREGALLERLRQVQSFYATAPRMPRASMRRSPVESNWVTDAGRCPARIINRV